MRNLELKKLFQQVQDVLLNLSKKGISWNAKHIRRNLNGKADYLANKGIDQA